MKYYSSFFFICHLIFCSGQDKVATPLQLVNRYCITDGADSKAYDQLFTHTNPQAVANAILERAKDSTNINQTYCVYLIRGLVKKQNNVVVRATYLKALNEIAFRSYNKTCNLAISTMAYFKKKEFNAEVYETLEIVITQRPKYCSEAILMYGFAAPKEKIDFLKKIQSIQSYSAIDKHNFTLALIRMGDVETTNLFLYELANKKINNTLVNSVLKELVYTRNVKVFQFLMEDFGNEKKACSSANNDSNEKILCAYRIIEGIGSKINDFPKLLNKYDEIEGDYATALSTARSWYDQNETSFTLNTEIY